MKFEDVKAGDYIVVTLTKKSPSANDKRVIILDRTEKFATALILAPSAFDASVRIEVRDYDDQDWRRRYWGSRAIYRDVDRDAKTFIIANFLRWYTG